MGASEADDVPVEEAVVVYFRRDESDLYSEYTTDDDNSIASGHSTPSMTPQNTITKESLANNRPIMEQSTMELTEDVLRQLAQANLEEKLEGYALSMHMDKHGHVVPNEPEDKEQNAEDKKQDKEDKEQDKEQEAKDEHPKQRTLVTEESPTTGQADAIDKADNISEASVPINDHDSIISEDRRTMDSYYSDMTDESDIIFVDGHV